MTEVLVTDTGERYHGAFEPAVKAARPRVSTSAASGRERRGRSTITAAKAEEGGRLPAYEVIP
ncbi:hypothetical protein [Streptosporangium sp. NPDC000509]|uniref:hypothetical protein n=1 Tax=Streptosporangium sp. NPDC000509 TaxID=3366186 RepID=UPI003691A155